MLCIKMTRESNAWPSEPRGLITWVTAGANIEKLRDKQITGVSPGS